ncbi:unnamed protein product [Effrenium voratum]|uniref:Uncharacterized protein n=1 Tax=Effrenium voratum TaxID=2562239 RepID=A0AA36JK42_9DINO|nr:unnamed protein product [Effrenium voratum]
MDLIELLESVGYKFDSSEIPAVKTGIKAGKTGQEILEEYQPYKQLLADIVAAAVPGVALQDGDEDSTAQSSQGAAAVASSTKTEQLHQCTTMHEEGIALGSVSDGWLAMADRIIAKNVVLVVEKGLTQTQLQNAMSKYAISKIRGQNGNNVVIYFDSNNFGEAITAPHIRRPPLQSTVVAKMWKALKAIREDPGSPGLLPPGDILVLLDGCRKTDVTVVNLFGMGKDRRTADRGRKERDGKTLSRQITVAFDEKSVVGRKFRKKHKNDFLSCSQRALLFWNGSTTSASAVVATLRFAASAQRIPAKTHKFFPEATNMSDVLGPFSLEAYQNLPKLRMKDKKEFWGLRRRAVGGRTEGANEDSDDDDNEPDEEEDQEVVPMLELPKVGGGRGSTGMPDDIVQCVNFQQLPSAVGESFLHSLSAISCCDLAPGTGELACSAVLEQVGYLGICQTEYQREFILTRLKKEVLRSMEEPSSKVYCAAYAKEVQEERGEKREAGQDLPNAPPKAKAKVVPPKKDKEEKAEGTAAAKAKAKSKSEAKVKAKPPPLQLSEKLQALLKVAKGQDPAE